MLNKDIKELQQAYSNILNETIDPNSYSDAIAHGVVAAGAVAVYYWPKIRNFFKPQEEKHIERLMREGNMKKVINNFIAKKTPEARQALRKSLQGIQEPKLSDNTIDKVIDKLSSITPERV